MKMTKKMLAAIDAGKYKMKRIEARVVTPAESPFKELRKDSAWLDAIFDIIDRTASTIKDELESSK